MVQIVGGIVVVLTLVGAAVWAWLTFSKGTTAGQSGVGKFITSVLESANLVTNLGDVERLSHVDAIEASPEAVKACEVIADTLWAAAKNAWKEAQQPAVVSAPTAITYVKVMSVDGTIVEVPLA